MTIRRRTKKSKGTKRVSYELIDRDNIAGRPVYTLLSEIVEQWHEDLVDARIALAWCTSWKPDVDGRVTLGKCQKASDISRELAPYDFVILLKKNFWYDAQVTEAQRRALLDHELCHAAVRYDDRSGEVVRDERGRKVYRMRKHDLEEFSAVVARHGTWKRDLETFAAALNLSARRDSWQPCEACRDTSPGWMTVERDGVKRQQRCTCFALWQERRAEAVAS